MEQSNDMERVRDDRAWNIVGWYMLLAQLKGAISTTDVGSHYSK